MMYDDYGERLALTQSMKSGANWFFWIAGLTLITSIVSLSGSNFGFFLSLGITQVIDAIFSQFGTVGVVIAAIFDVLITGMFIGFGVLAGRKQLWAFIVGMVLFGLDTFILLLGMQVIAILLHGLALFYMFRGFQAGRELVAKEKAAASQPPPPPQPAEVSASA